MKIYHKKNFAEGLFMLVLGLLNLSTGISQSSITVKDGIVCAALFLFGGTLLLRSLSSSASRQDKIEAMDERNQLIKLKSESRAFVISRSVLFVLILGCVAAYIATKNLGIIGIMVGLSLAWGLSFLTEIFTYIYYESKN